MERDISNYEKKQAIEKVKEGREKMRKEEGKKFWRETTDPLFHPKRKEKPEPKEKSEKEETPKYRPAATYRKEPKSKPVPRQAPRKSHRQPARGRTRAPAPPSRINNFLPDMGVHYQPTPMDITPPDFSLPFTGGFGNPPRRRRKKGRRQSSGINFGFTNPNYIPPGLKRFF